jgi:hypothetical protein
MLSRSLAFALVSLLAFGVGSLAEEKTVSPDAPVFWRIDNLKEIGGHKVTVVGEPRRVASTDLDWLEFDGRDDGIFLDVHPLAGAKQFTAEVIFRPDADGPAEQRFFHMQENDSENRILFETRLREGKWFLDTFIQSGEAGATLFAEKFQHPLGKWYHAAIVVDGKEMRAYVNGQLEMSTPLAFEPQKAGKTSLGVRINKVFWFKGAIRGVRFTRRVMEPKEFLKP